MACSKCGKILDVSKLPPFFDIECPFCQTLQKVPAVFGAFLLAEQLGSGGMGAVYRAVDRALGRFVAIKVMKQHLGADIELVESFLREARAAAALNHPNIVQIYSCGQEKGQPYIVMELVGGGRLDQLMEGGKRVDEVRLLEVAVDVAEGLKAANGIGLVHGDIKPANILFDQSGTAKVVDFGLAQFVNRQQEQGGVWGTPYYISPERARGGKADHRSDIYSLGATMFHALTGVPPFDGKTATDVVVARLKAPPPKLLELESSLQVETARLVERMMAADPVLRFPTSASLLADMRGALSMAKLSHSSIGRKKKQKEREWGHLIVLGAALLVMLIGIFFVIRWFKQASPPVAPTVTGPARSVAVVLGSTNAPIAIPDPEATAIIQKENGKPKQTLLFFSGASDAALVQALSGLVGDKPMAANDAVEALSADVPPKSARRMWLRVLQAPACWLAGDPARAEKVLRAAAAMEASQEKGHPVFMPQQLAAYLLGELEAPAFEAARAGWPAWYGDLAAGLTGFKALTSGDLAGAATAFETYLAGGRNEPAWAYGLRPSAKIWRDKIEGWEKERLRLVALVEAGKIDAARAGADAAQQGAPAFTKTLWDSVREQIRRVELAQEEKRKAEAEAQRQVLVGQEAVRLDEFMSTNVQYTGVAKDYRKVIQVLARFLDELQQPENREKVAVLREQMESMERLKTLLIKEMEGNPFRGTGAEAAWGAVGANVLGVRVSQSGQVTRRNWDQIAPRFMIRMVVYYADQPDRSAADKADIYLSLALFCRYNNLMTEDLYGRFLQFAQEPGPAAAEKVRRLLPETIPPG